MDSRASPIMDPVNDIKAMVQATLLGWLAAHSTGMYSACYLSDLLGLPFNEVRDALTAMTRTTPPLVARKVGATIHEECTYGIVVNVVRDVLENRILDFLRVVPTVWATAPFIAAMLSCNVVVVCDAIRRIVNEDNSRIEYRDSTDEDEWPLYKLALNQVAPTVPVKDIALIIHAWLTAHKEGMWSVPFLANHLELSSEETSAALEAMVKEDPPRVHRSPSNVRDNAWMYGITAFTAEVPLSDFASEHKHALVVVSLRDSINALEVSDAMWWLAARGLVDVIAGEVTLTHRGQSMVNAILDERAAQRMEEDAAPIPVKDDMTSTVAPAKKRWFMVARHVAPATITFEKATTENDPWTKAREQAQRPRRDGPEWNW